ncbi:MAG: CPBP family intramembrane metalloprotease [Oscillospiraceae bacterium]|nr:CPBP family intramembrane metalloprotease [Oscillospiraceae bacterium]
MKHDIRLSDTAPIFARIRQNPNQRVPKGILLNCLVFSAYLLVDGAGQEIGLLLFSLILSAISPGDTVKSFFENEPMREILLMLYLTVVSILLNFAYCCGVEKRPARTLGITKRRALPDYLLGFLLGTGMMTAVMLLIQAGGGASFRGVSESVPAGYMVLFLFAWVIQGFSEELAFRGYLMMSVGTHTEPGTGIAVSSVLFAAAHLGNDGVSLFAFCNLALFGLLTALLFLRTDSIWCTAAMHSFWNMAQSNLFGMKVSGIEISASFLRYDTASGHTWLNGGRFGPEGGAATTAVLAIAILLVYLLPQRTVHLPASAPAEANQKGVS